MSQRSLVASVALLGLASCSSPPGEHSNPVLKVTPVELDFSTGLSGPLNFTVSNTGTGKMDYRILKQEAWLAINNDFVKTEIVASTTTQDMVYAVTIDRGKLAPNQNQAQITIIPSVGNSQVVAVRATSDKCTSGYSRCADSFNIAFCGSAGAWQAPQACGEGKYCDRPSSQCRPQQCKPSEFKCFSNSSSQQCSADGSSWQAPVNCPAGQVCIQASGSCASDIKPSITSVEGDGSQRPVVDYQSIVPASGGNVMAGYRVQTGLIITGSNLLKVNPEQTILECAQNKNVFFTAKEGLTFEQGGTDMKRKLLLPTALGRSLCSLFVLTLANAAGTATAQVYVLQGEPGHTSLVDVQDEAAGANCPAGGKKILSGLDANDDGTLAAAEVKSTKFLCNGVNGKTALVDIQDEAAGTNCPAGGKKVISGLDTSGDGTLASSEATVSKLVCNGPEGKKGAEGALPGTVSAFAGPTVPEGWLLCDGKAVSRTTYAALFSAIGTTHGAGDNATSFNLPDYRGRFLRGVDSGAGRDPDAANRAASAANGTAGDKVGSVQEATFATHNHKLSDPGHTHALMGQVGCGIAGGGSACAWAPYASVYNIPDSGGRATGISLESTGGSETRPVNASVQYIIKY